MSKREQSLSGESSIENKISIAAQKLFDNSMDDIAAIEFAKLRFAAAVGLESAPLSELTNFVQSQGFFKAINHSLKVVQLLPEEKKLLITLQKFLSKKSFNNEAVIRKLMISLLYFKPYQIPSDILFSAAFKGCGPYAFPLYSFRRLSPQHN